MPYLDAAHNRRSAVVLLGQESIVLRAEEAEVARIVAAAHGKWTAVVELEAVPLGAAPALFIREAAAGAISLVHGAAHRCRDVARGAGRVRVGERGARSRRLAEAPGFETLELLG